MASTGVARHADDPNLQCCNHHVNPRQSQPLLLSPPPLLLPMSAFHLPQSLTDSGQSERINQHGDPINLNPNVLNETLTRPSFN